MNIQVERYDGSNQGPDIVDSLLVSDAAGVERGRAEINEDDSSRKIISGNGPKNTLMIPCFLTEIIKREVRYKGILQMYARSYNLSKRVFSIDSAISIEVKIPDTRPK